tara:strand:+ start:45 stop:785 length:741 start_codon:yes stop_codon:yes gene_type:complete
MKLSNRLRFILVNTSRAGNFGAAARALKNMGFSNLYLVSKLKSDINKDPEAISFASGANDILDKAQIVNSLEDALVDCNYTIAVSARKRELSPLIYTPREISQLLYFESKINIAFIFGNEQSGLPNEIVNRCNALIKIPSNPDYSSLNLSQAVQIIAYECKLANDITLKSYSKDINELATTIEIESMFLHLEEALSKIEFLDNKTSTKLIPKIRRLFNRVLLEKDEVNIIRGISSKIIKMLVKPKL